METPISLRIAIAVFGFGLIVAAELMDNAHARKPAGTGAHRGDTFMDDAKVFTMRIAGAMLIGIGLLMFVAASHMSIF